MTPQTILDTVTAHLFKQGIQSVNPGASSCAYRGANNTACAVGCLMTEEQYSPELEGESAFGLTKVYTDLAKPIPAWLKEDAQISLLASLQDIHDRHMPDDEDGPERKRVQLQKVALKIKQLAEKEGLTTPADALAHLPTIEGEPTCIQP